MKPKGARHALRSTQNETVTAKSLSTLRTALQHQVTSAYRSAWIVDTLNESEFTLAGVRQYYVQSGERTIKVRRAYRDTFRGPVKTLSGGRGLSVVMPKLGELFDAYERAYTIGLAARSAAVRRTHAPFVAQVDSVGTSLGVFKTMHDFLSRDSLVPRGWAEERNTSQRRKYLSYLEEISVLRPTAEGHKLTDHAEGQIRQVHELMGSFGQDLADDSHVPFLSLALAKPEVLARQMHLNSAKTYFDLLETVFNYQFFATSDNPLKFSMPLGRLIDEQARLFGKHDDEHVIGPRVRELVGIRALDEPAMGSFSLRQSAFAEAVKILDA